MVIEVPLSHMVSVAQGDDFLPVEITDKIAFAEYFARYLNARRGEDVLGSIDREIERVRHNAIYFGAGIRSQLEDIPNLVDRMWRNHDEVLLSGTGAPAGMTTHGCLVEAIHAAREGKLDAAARWLDIGQDCNESVAEALEENLREAVSYAFSVYGPNLDERHALPIR